MIQSLDDIASDIKKGTSNQTLVVASSVHSPETKRGVVIHLENREYRRTLWQGVCDAIDLDHLVEQIKSGCEVWRGNMEHIFPARGSWRLIWTVPPAPFCIFGRWWFRCSVDEQLVHLHRCRDSRVINRSEIESVSAWQSQSWYWTGVSLNLRQGDVLLVQLFNVGPVGDPITYDGLDVITDRFWADRLAQTMSEVLRVPCHLRD